MFNQEAIQELKQDDSTSAILDAISEIQEEALVPLAPKRATPESIELQSIEKYMEFRARYRMSFDTSSIKEFIQYCINFSRRDAICLIDVDSMRAKTIFDMGSIERPEHQEHTAKINLKETSAYKKIIRHDGDHLSQKAAGEFLEDWYENIICYTKEGDSMSAKEAANALYKLTIESARQVESSVSDFSAEISDMQRIEAKTAGKQPAEIHFKCEPYYGFSTYNFVIKLSIVTGEKTPYIGFRIAQREAIEEEIVNEFKEKVVDGLKDTDIQTYIGQSI